MKQKFGLYCFRNIFLKNLRLLSVPIIEIGSTDHARYSINCYCAGFDFVQGCRLYSMALLRKVFVHMANILPSETGDQNVSQVRFLANSSFCLPAPLHPPEA